MTDAPLATAARFRAMGTDVEVLAVGADASGMARLGALAADALEAREARWSRFRPSSELCRINDTAGAPVVVSPDTFNLIALAVDAWRATDGRYDPTVLAALQAAGYDRDFDAVARDGGHPVGVHPTVPGCDGVELDRVVSAVRLPRGVALDLGGIGKGYAADVVSAELLEARVPGVRGILLNLGGDLRARGDAPEPDGWVVDVDDPLGTGRTGLVALAEGAVATSTRLRRAWPRSRSWPARRGGPRCWPRRRSSRGPRRGPSWWRPRGPPVCWSRTPARSWSSTASPRFGRDYPRDEHSAREEGMSDDADHYPRRPLVHA